MGYPEAEKLVLLSGKLNVYLDSLMSTGSEQKNNDKNTNVTGRIVITSPHENVIAACHKVLSSGKMFGGKLSPQYALFGVDNVSSSFWENPIFFRMVCR